MPRVSLSLLGVLALSSSACSSPADGRAPTSADGIGPSSRDPRPVPPIAWTPCGGAFECGTAQVPLDYDDPRGPTVSIALARLPATDPGRRIGTLFLNPGGPGDSGVDFTMQHGPYLYTDEVRARFDLVGFDPRGQGRSTPLRCFRSLAELGPALHVPPYPGGADERSAWIAADRYLDAGCDEHGGRIGGHMSTANVARDLDRLREAVGDPQLTYNGYSSGTYLGATYANLFPGKVRAMILDGALDPRAWSTGTGREGERVPSSARTHAAAGALATLQEFFRLCDEGGPQCPFSGDSARRFAALVERLGVEPVVVPLPDGSVVEVNDTFLIAVARDAMADSLGLWPTLAEQLAGLEALAGLGPSGAATAGAIGTLPSLRLAAAARTGGAQEQYPNDLEGRYGMICVDTVNPRSYAAWQRAAAADGIFGPYWTWWSSRCAEWPFEDDDRYLGPFDARTANPVLVVGNLFDPATRYEGAVALARTFRSSALLTVHGWGHSSHGWGPTPRGISSCADEVGARYLVSLALPAPGTVCEQDVVPFGGE
jgi:pimeloyl-ACP methyl ester carboxylesterase